MSVLVMSMILPWPLWCSPAPELNKHIAMQSRFEVLPGLAESGPQVYYLSSHFKVTAQPPRRLCDCYEIPAIQV